MIRRLRRKFILIASGAILLILVIVIFCINGVNSYSNYTESISILKFIAENNGRLVFDNHHNQNLNFHITEELPYEIRYFTMILDEEQELFLTDYEHIAAVDTNDADLLRKGVILRNKNQGYVSNSDGIYMYLMKQINGEALQESFTESAFRTDRNYDIEIDCEADYSLIVFMDCTNRIYRLQRLRIFSIIIGLICLVMFIVLVSFFSKIAIKPVIESYEKQKQFITNAGHELKTPLAIISANAEVLEAMDGESEWTQSILNQVRRLTGLVNDMITLARLEEASEREEMPFEQIAFSEKVKEVAESFRPVIKQQGKKLNLDIVENSIINGNEKSVHELISILIDNAVKYCDDGGLVHVTLKQQKKAVLIIENSYANGANVDYSRFFDRFYREDTSHNQEKPGYGIGLSMAESIVNVHKGKISVSYHDGMIAFQVTI